MHRVRFPRRNLRIPCSIVVALLMLVGGRVAHAGEFPDEWFFSGAERPQALRELEGRTAAALDLDTWIGDETSLESCRGKVVIIDFWATWCGPCMAAIPENIKLVDTYGEQGLRFIGVHDSKSGWDTADAVVRDKGINYPVAKDNNGATVKAYHLSFWPTYVAVDRKGVIRAAGLRPDKIEEVVRTLLAEAAPAGAARATSEFAPEWYVGGAKRPSRLAALEGRPAPPELVVSWLGDPITPEQRAGRVTVLHFVAPWSAASRAALPAWRALATDLQRQGVVLVGICDHAGDWERMATLLGDEPAFPIARDAPPPPDSTLPLGATATAYGVRMWPTTIVIDRAGRVRAAGLRDDRVRAVVGVLMAEPLVAPPAPAPSAPAGDGV